VSPVKYELSFHIPEDDILHSHCRETSDLTWQLLAVLCNRDIVSPVRYELGFYIPEDGILHGHRRGNLKSYEEKYVRMSTYLQQQKECMAVDA
jgi:hypothetical protein